MKHLPLPVDRRRRPLLQYLHQEGTFTARLGPSLVRHGRARTLLRDVEDGHGLWLDHLWLLLPACWREAIPNGRTIRFTARCRAYVRGRFIKQAGDPGNPPTLSYSLTPTGFPE